MPVPTSALELNPQKLMREVSPEAIEFYVDGLSGIYLPEEFKEEHTDLFDVKIWRPTDRLKGKFGRFVLKHEQESEVPLADILVMGTTIGLHGIDRHNDMHSLRHYELSAKIRDIMQQRGLLGQAIEIEDVDYGSTTIKLDEAGPIEALSIAGASIDYGRAAAEGRQATCDLFAKLLGAEIQIINADPEPRSHERIIKS